LVWAFPCKQLAADAEAYEAATEQGGAQSRLGGDRFILAPMALKDIVARIDEEIARLQQARSLLAASGISVALPTVGRGRPKKNAGTSAPSKPAKKKRNLSPEGRARIAEAAKRRWAKLRAKGK
jgi:hypothetical protein